MKNLLKIKRWEAGLKQYELAARLGCTASYLSMVENGRVDPNWALKAKAATILNIDIEVLFPPETLEHDSRRPGVH